MEYNARFLDAIGLETVAGVSEADIPQSFREVVRGGWYLDESGACLLTRLKDGYYGDRSSFSDVTGYEAAVNGRGIPDLDVVLQGSARAREIARRGYAFAWAALYESRQASNMPVVTAYLSISRVEMDDDETYTGSVTFCAHHDGEPPYISDIAQPTYGPILVLASTECDTPLAASSQV